MDLLLSDMAPNLSGMDAIDAPRGMYLAELALDLAREVLKPGANALIKVLQGAGFEELVAVARTRFGRAATSRRSMYPLNVRDLPLAKSNFRFSNSSSNWSGW